MSFKSFEIELTHHLAAEQEMFEAGLLLVPTPIQLDPAKRMPTIHVRVNSDLILKKIEKSYVPVKMRGRRIPGWDSTISRRGLWGIPNNNVIN